MTARLTCGVVCLREDDNVPDPCSFLGHILFPLCGKGVSRMLNDLKREQFVGKSRSELVARFGKPSIQRAIPGAQEEFIFTCRPWFYGSYPEGVCVNVSKGKVASFAYYH